MYTSGCPHTQKKLAQSIGIPPSATVKNAVSKILSVVNNANATVNTGKARITINAVMKVVTVNIGISMNFIVGVLHLSIVTQKLIHVISVPIPEICIAIK